MWKSGSRWKWVQNVCAEPIKEQVIKFTIVGGTAFLIDYGLLYMLTKTAGMHYLTAGMISFGLSVLFNYMASMCWVFNPKKNENRIMEFAIFSSLSLFGLMINQAVMYVAVEVLHIYYLAAKIIATLLVMVYNFVSRKLFLE